MKIHKEIESRIHNYWNSLRLTYGYKNLELKNAEELANKMLDKKLTKIENRMENGSDNNGVSWRWFKRENASDIYMRDKGRCHYCDIHLGRDEITLDHLLPVSRGGITSMDNVVIACSWCNQDKGMLTNDEYRYKQMHNKDRGILSPGEEKLLV